MENQNQGPAIEPAKLLQMSPEERDRFTFEHFKKVMQMTGFEDLSESAVRATMERTFQDIKKERFLGNPKRRDTSGRIGCHKINVLYNDTTGEHIVIRVIHVGATPEVYAHPISGNPLRGCSFFCPQNLEPTYEFFRPTTEQIKKINNPYYREYCKRGGFLFQPVVKKKEPIVKPSL